MSEIHNFVKVLPEGTSVDDFMRAQPPLLGGTVGNLSRIRPRCFVLGIMFRLDDPPLEEKMFECAYCGSTMTKDYIDWHMNAKYVAHLVEGCGSNCRCRFRHNKVARPGDVAFWTFPPEAFRAALDLFNVGLEDDLED